MKDSFVFYTEYREAVRCMTDEQAGMLLKALISYTDREVVKLTDPTVNMFFLTIKPRMDRDREKWEETVEKRKEAGKKGGIARAENAKKAKQSQANAINAKQSQANQAVSDADSVTESVSNTPLNPPKRGNRENQLAMFDRLIDGRAVSSDMVAALREWIRYKTERNERYKESGMRSLITQAVNRGAAHGGGAVCDAIRSSMASGYKGIVWDQIGKSPPGNRFNNAPERSYDMDELEKELLASQGG